MAQEGKSGEACVVTGGLGWPVDEEQVDVAGQVDAGDVIPPEGLPVDRQIGERCVDNRCWCSTPKSLSMRCVAAA